MKKMVFCLALGWLALGVACGPEAERAGWPDTPLVGGAREALVEEPGRGAWMWRESAHRYGTARTVGNPAREERVLQKLDGWEVGRLYAYYGRRAETNPNALAAWNAKLHQRGLRADLLMSDNHWIFPEAHEEMHQKLQARLLDFNRRAAPQGGRFDALHLDIEPHLTDDWGAASARGKVDLLWMWLDTMAEARRYLDANGGQDLRMYTDIPVWWDNVGGSLGWTNEAERDAWFDAAFSILDGMTLMAYERNTQSHIESGVAWEVGRYPGRCRVALDLNFDTWSRMARMMEMAEHLEAAGYQVDLHHVTKMATQ